MSERGITNISLEKAIVDREIIEEYPDDVPCPSALIFSIVNETPMHIVIGHCTDHIRIITCYFPDETEWINYRIRRS